MKKLLFLFAIVTMFASCTKDASVSQPTSEQKGKKQKIETLALSIAQDFPAGEDSVVSIDSVKYEQVGSYTGNNVSWSVRSNDLPSMQLVVQVYHAAGFTDKWGVTSANAYWGTVGSLWDGGSIKTNPAAGSIFDGYPTQNETRIYRAQFIDKNGIVHYSSAYQVN
jgi:hypothetical protein